MSDSSLLRVVFNPHEFRERFRPYHLIFFPYVLAVVWQYFWSLPNKTVGWTIASIISLGVCYGYVVAKPKDDAKVARSFWLIVVVPLLIIYSSRVLFPDISFDVLNYHIFHGERGLRGPLLIPGDFFPTPAPFNPAPDILTALYRQLLGYRLGTIANLFAVLWVGYILDQFLRDYLRKSWFRAVLVLFILCTEQIFFQINNYMVDLLALPLLLEATRLALSKVERYSEMRRAVIVALLLGISVAFKLANLAFALPIGAVWFFSVIANREGVNIIGFLKIATGWVIAFLAPLLPFSVLLYRLTRNPVFPFYNATFKSSYWPVSNVFDPRWGPHSFIEGIVWPVVVFVRPERFCEFPVYSGRVTLGFFASIACVFLARKDRTIFSLSVITLLGCLLWSFASGYSRYAIYLELTSGILLVWFVHALWRTLRHAPALVRWSLPIFIGVLCMAQAIAGLAYSSDYEWSMRGTILRHRLPYTLYEAKNVLRDRNLQSYLSPDDKNAVSTVNGWLETSYKTTALMALLKPNVPVIGLRTQEYFAQPAGRYRVNELLFSNPMPGLFTLSDAENLQSSKQILAARGLKTISMRPLSIPYFSQSTRFEMLLIEVRPAQIAEDSSSKEVARGVPLSDAAFNARITVSELPTTMRAGEKYVLDVTLQNASVVKWPGRQSTWQYQITVGNRWLTENGAVVNDVDGRAALADDLASGQTSQLRLTVTAPNQPGTYMLQLDAVQEGVAWFGDRGSVVLNSKVKVE